MGVCIAIKKYVTVSMKRYTQELTFKPGKGYQKPGACAAQEHVRDVGAGDQEHKADRAEHKQEDQPDLSAIHHLMEGPDTDPVVLMAVGKLLSQAVRNHA